MMTAKSRQSGLACAVDGTIGDSLADDPHYPSRPAEYATDATDANHQTKPNTRRMISRPSHTPASRVICSSSARGVLLLLAGVVVALVSAAPSMTAAETASTAETAAIALEHLRAANVARAELARTEANWISERERLTAAIAATRAEVGRLERDATEAETQRDHARTRLAAIGAANDLDTLRTRLDDAAKKMRTTLATLAATVPPGVIALPADDLAGDAAFDSAVRALDAAERAAGTLAVEVVSGTRAGQAEAVKLLRVAGAAAWWVSLDGRAAGTAQMVDGKLQLNAAADERTRLAITAALAQAEGRAQPTIILLPAPVRAGGQP